MKKESEPVEFKQDEEKKAISPVDYLSDPYRIEAGEIEYRICFE